MNNLVGEFTINRNTLSLQNEQLRRALQELLRRFSRFQEMGNQLRDLSDQMLVIPERYSSSSQHQLTQQFRQNANVTHSHASESSWLHQTNFDSLELDSYGEVHLLLQSTLEEIAQL
ncbi:hypothetical protein [Leptolyngbya sp. FACHB-541]|uniref:hypothetical protein n=1 Tax=Leptolyngbya sp. FACHB-541 TaxID=2692810 RepID=UPI0018EF6E0F|nr:hypothetical protein [Leptolyngbya sp. FACHB-541]